MSSFEPYQDWLVVVAFLIPMYAATSWSHYQIARSRGLSEARWIAGLSLCPGFAYFVTARLAWPPLEDTGSGRGRALGLSVAIACVAPALLVASAAHAGPSFNPIGVMIPVILGMLGVWLFRVVCIGRIARQMGLSTPVALSVGGIALLCPPFTCTAPLPLLILGGVAWQKRRRRS